MITLLRNKFSLATLSLFAVLIFISCRKDVSNEDGNGFSGQTPDLATKVTSSVSGFVTDENNAAVAGALVKVGGMQTTTDQYGFFQVKNVQVVKTAAVVTVTNPGYFNGIKTYTASDNKAAFFRIKLMPKTNAGTINAATGGNVTLGNGLIIALPANAVVKASDNSAYSGTINVAAHWINPAANDIDMIMPGDLRGIDDAGLLQGLTTYGMAAVELTGASGELLQIATGKKATLTIPLPTGAATAPLSIPLWHFDETTGLWKQEGSATKTGNAYVGEVSHFSFWNCDLPNMIVPVTFTVVDASGNPLNNVYVNIVPPNPDPIWAHVGGFTDSTGYVSVFVTPNTTYSLYVNDYTNNCNGFLVQTFTVGTAPVALGNVVVGSQVTASVTGTVTDCSNNPVTNGYIILQSGYQFFRHELNSTGSYSFTPFICNGASAVTLIGEDASTMQQSTPITHTLVPGTNVIGNLQACGISTQQFFTYTVDGGPAISFNAPGDSVYHSGFGTNSVSFIGGFTFNSNNYANISFDNIGIGTGSSQNLMGFQGTGVNDSTIISTPISVNITEYGAVGEFIAGNFSGALTGHAPLNTVYNVSCSFRVRRQF